jgi:hypothetical protein
MNENEKAKTNQGSNNNNVIYLLIAKIPLEFHTPDLRNFFAQSIEQESFTCFNYRHRPDPKTGEFNLAICKIKPNKYDEFLTLYNDKNWTNVQNKTLNTKCKIVRIRVSQSKKVNESDEALSMSSFLSETDLNDLLEFKNVPKWMPQGNVGTPTKTFIKYINQCQMPTSLISKLGINLKHYKQHKKKPYSNVAFKYDDAQNEYEKSSTSEEDDDEVTDLTKDKKESDSELEEWERHESLHDNVTKQDRTSPCFYEQEIELQWEKGGSGLVFYTVKLYDLKINYRCFNNLVFKI